MPNCRSVWRPGWRRGVNSAPSPIAPNERSQTKEKAALKFSLRFRRISTGTHQLAVASHCGAGKVSCAVFSQAIEGSVLLT